MKMRMKTNRLSRKTQLRSDIWSEGAETSVTVLTVIVLNLLLLELEDNRLFLFSICAEIHLQHLLVVAAGKAEETCFPPVYQSTEHDAVWW